MLVAKTEKQKLIKQKSGSEKYDTQVSYCPNLKSCKFGFRAQYKSFHFYNKKKF